MSGKEGKRSKGRRSLYTPKTSSNSTLNGSNNTGTSQSRFQPFGGDLTMNVCDMATDFSLNLKSTTKDAEKITELMDAPLDLHIPGHAHAPTKGPNPYLDRCMYCNTPRTDPHNDDSGTAFIDLSLDDNTVITNLANSQSFSSLKLELWTCPTCREVAGNFQSFLEANLSQASCDMPLLHDAMPCQESLPCVHCEEERTSHEQEAQEVQENYVEWVKLRSIVKDLYISQVELAITEEQCNRLQYLVDKLCQKDPHQLFIRLESQVREIVTDIKVNLVTKLKEKGCSVPELALDFTSTFLAHYQLLTKKAHLLAQYLGSLAEHLTQFQVTWELLNKHLFHTIVHNDPIISNSGPTILEQLRQGSLQFEKSKSKDDPYCSVRKSLLKFQDEMSVVVVVWRDCQQLIESYCQEEVKNTRKEVSNIARSFISQQRQFLKEHLMKEPLTNDALTETMKNLTSGHSFSTDQMCLPCRKERCNHDECTITHMITNGIITEKNGEMSLPLNSFSISLDHARSMIDITPPSMSSTTSSSGSVSPINVDDKATTYYDCERALTEEFRDAMLKCNGHNGHIKGYLLNKMSNDVDDNAGDDEEDDDDDDDDNDIEDEEDSYANNQDTGCDEPHAVQLPIWETVEQANLLHPKLQETISQQSMLDRMASQHSCAQCHQFQPRIDSQLSKQLEAELVNSSLATGVINDCVMDGLSHGGDTFSDSGGGGGGAGGGAEAGVNSNKCGACQCHACLNQSGHMISTSLPLQVPLSPPPAELHLYPHIHGLPPQLPHRNMFDLPSLMPPIKLPIKLDFDDPNGIQDQIYDAYSDWDNTLTARPGSLAAQYHLQHQHQHHLSELLPPVSLNSTTTTPFNFEALTLATHTTQTSTTNTTSAFKSVAGKQGNSSILPSLSSMSSEGSSVDPTKPLDFASLIKIPQSCLNSLPSASSSCISSSSAASSTVAFSTSVIPSLPVSTPSKSSVPCHGPPCLRPTPLGGNATTASKWERGQCKKLTAANSVSGLLNKQNPSGVVEQPPPQQHQLHHQHSLSGVSPFSTKLPSSFASHSLRPPLPCSHIQNPPARAVVPQTPVSLVSSTASSLGHVPPPPPSSTAPVSVLPYPRPPTALSNANHVPAMVNNIGVGTTTLCVDPDCEAHHHDDNCDSVDDDSSEKSSNTSTSNQKEGKYCDCCYCEFFGHNNTQVAKTSSNYAEIKDRLRKKLKKRQNENKDKTVVVPKNPPVEVEESKEEIKKDFLDKQGIEGLLSFINGTNENGQSKKDKEQTAKAAKRARQKQRKMEEKARTEKSNPHGTNTCQFSELIFQNAVGLHPPPSSCELQDPAKHPNLRKCQGSRNAGKNGSQEKEKRNGEVAASISLTQEVTRPSLVIESRKAPKEPGKTLVAQKLVTNNNNMKDTPQHVNYVLDMLESLKQKQKQESQSTANGKTPPAAAATANGGMEVSKKSNGGSLNGKSGETSKNNSKSQQQHQRNQTSSQQQSQKQKSQQSSSKSQNDKSSVQFNGATKPSSNGGGSRSVTSEKKGSSQQQVTSTASMPTKSMPTASTANSTSQTKTVMNGCAKSPSSTESPSPGSGSSTSQSPSSGSKSSTEQGKTGGKSKKNKKKKNGDISGFDEVFMPKAESEMDGDVDDFERELEEFKRFCFEPAEPKERRKIAVNVNMKDIFKKKTAFV